MIQKVQILNKRLTLIDKCQQFSLLRLNHLEEIFKYYCSHIYKVGKHMTFDRLEYEKQHLNSERFFLFLKDFGLTVMEIQNKPKEIISKQNIMTIFKKISSNCRDLTFQQFVKCLQKIAIVYYDQKTNYWTKLQEQKLQKIKRKKQIEKKKIKRMKLNGQKIDEKQLQQVQKLQKQQNQLNLNSKNQNNEEQQVQKNNHSEEQNNNNEIIKKVENQQPQFDNQNDDLIKQMMQNKDLQDPNEQINKIVNKNKEQNLEINKKKKIEKDYEIKLLSLTNNEKIQYFYQLIGVDSVKDYKNKLTILNMPEFKGKKVKQSQKTIDQSRTTIDQSISNQRSNSVQEQQRLMKLKQKMNQKKEKRKNQPIPKPKQQKQSETARKRRQMKKERQFRMQQKLKEKQMQNDALHQKKKDQKNGTKGNKAQENTLPSQKPNFNQKEVNWSMLQKMSLQQLKLRHFNPNKFYNQDEDDHIFLHEYGVYRQPSQRAQRIQARQRQSLSIVQNVRKRANQVQKNEKKQQNKLITKINQERKYIKGKF